MTLATVADFTARLRALPLLDERQLAALAATVKRCADLPALTRQLIESGWLTAFQVDRLVLGRERELVLGPYVVLDKLGAGGRGQVYRVRHRELGRIQALKLLAPHLIDSDDARQRFSREMKAMGALAHPHIVTVFDAGTIGETCFIALELVEGTDLHRRVVEQGPLPIDAACEAVRQAALGLHHAHERGLVHRDVKPGNLLYLPDGPIRVKVADLGMAAWTTRENEAGDTPSNVALGTPDFMAPEQALDARRADARSDVYALGCTLYFLLTGQVPFPGGTATQKLLAHLNDTPAPIESLRPGLQPGLAAIVRRMMARDAEERFPTAHAAAAALAAYCDVSPAPSTTDARRPAPSTVPPLPLPSRSPSTAPPVPATRWRVGLWLLLGGLALAVPLLLALVVSLFLLSNPVEQNGGAPSVNADGAPLPVPGPTMKAERFDGAPEGLVGVLGDRRLRQWDRVIGLAPQPKGKLIASLEQGGGIYLWDRATGALVHRLGRPGKVGPGLAFSEDGQLLATGGDEPRVWRAPDWKATSLPGPTAWTAAVAVLPGGERVAAGGEDKVIRLWGTRNGMLRASLKGHTSPIAALAASPAGDWLASGSDGGEVFLWELPATSPKIQLRPTRKNILALAFSPDGALLASGDKEGILELWDARAGTSKGRLGKHEAPVRALAFHRDGRYLVSASWDASVRCWDVGSRGEHAERRADWQRYNAVAFDAEDAGLVWFGGEDGVVRRWRPLEKREEKVPGLGHEGPIKALRFALGDKLLLSTGDDGTVRLWEWPSGKAAEVLRGHRGTAWALAVRSDGKEAASGGQDEEVRIWDLEPRGLRKALRTKVWTYSLAYAWDDRLAVGTKEDQVHLWDIAAGKRERQLTGHRDILWALAFDGQRLVSGDGSWEGEGVLRGWSKDRTDEPTFRTGGHKHAVAAIALSPNGEAIATGDTGMVRLFTSTGKRSYAEPSWEKSRGVIVSGVAFSRDGKWLASCDLEGHVVLRDPATAKPRHSWTMPGPVGAVVFTPDNRHLLTGNADGTVYVLRLPGEK